MSDHLDEIIERAMNRRYGGWGRPGCVFDHADLRAVAEAALLQEREKWEAHTATLMKDLEEMRKKRVVARKELARELLEKHEGWTRSGLMAGNHEPVHPYSDLVSALEEIDGEGDA